jgi:hypothetical protein
MLRMSETATNPGNDPNSAQSEPATTAKRCAIAMRIFHSDLAADHSDPQREHEALGRVFRLEQAEGVPE